jgi:hypothetical protein
VAKVEKKIGFSKKYPQKKTKLKVIKIRFGYLLIQTVMLYLEFKKEKHCCIHLVNAIGMTKCVSVSVLYSAPGVN